MLNENSDGDTQNILEMDSGDGFAQCMSILNTTEVDYKVVKMVCFRLYIGQNPQMHMAHYC